METNEKEDESKLEKLVGNVVECIETRVDLVAIDMQYKMAEIFASVASLVVIATVLLLMILILSIGVAMYLSNLYKSTYMGFVYVAAFYALLALVIYLSKAKLIKLPVINTFIRKLNFNEED
jgi:uncharacterized membrane protein YqjE